MTVLVTYAGLLKYIAIIIVLHCMLKGIAVIMLSALVTLVMIYIIVRVRNKYFRRSDTEGN